MFSVELQLAALNAATAANETRPKSIPPHERTSVTSLSIEETAPSNIVIRDKITGRRLEEVFATDTPFHRHETEINLKMLHQLARTEDGAMSVWLSPPWPGNDLGKILVATVRNGLHEREIVQFDVTGPMFDQKQFNEFSSWLAPFSQDGYFILKKSPLDFLRRAIPIPKVWDGIADGSLETKFKEMVKQMQPLVEKHSGKELVKEIYRITGADTRLACPEPTTFLRVSLNSDGEILHRVEKCPCGFDVKKAKPEGIPAGWQCPSCGGVYKGC